MLQIGQFSKLCKVTIKTLRYYDKINLLKPSYINKKSNYRYYDYGQIATLANIHLLKSMDFSLEEIKGILSHELENEEVDFIRLLSQKRALIQKNISMEKKKLEKVNHFIHSIEEMLSMSEISIKKLPEVIVASMRVKVKNHQELNQVVPNMGRLMTKHGVVCRDPFYCFNIYHDEEYREEDVDVEICEAVIKQYPNADGVIYKTIPAVKTAISIMHKGVYETLGVSLAKALKWGENSGYKMIDKIRFSYIDGCWNTENPEEWLTEIQIPCTSYKK